MTIEKKVLKLNWEHIDKYKFKNKQFLKRVMEGQEVFLHVTGDGQVSKQAIRNKLYIALASIAIEMLKENAKAMPPKL